MNQLPNAIDSSFEFLRTQAATTVNPSALHQQSLENILKQALETQNKQHANFLASFERTLHRSLPNVTHQNEFVLIPRDVILITFLNIIFYTFLQKVATKMKKAFHTNIYPTEVDALTM